MIALVAGLSVLTLVSGLAAQQSTSSNGTKLQRTDRNFVTQAAEGGRMEVSGSSRKAEPPATRSSSSVSVWSKTMAPPTGS